MQSRTIEAGEPQRWSALQRAGLRFLFVYFLLFVLTGEEVRLFPFSGPLFDRYTALWHAVAVWVGRHLLGIRSAIALGGDGSGDTTFRWILLLCYPVVAAAVVAVWSALDRRSESDESVRAWLRFLLGFTLAAAMIVYGTIKVIPTQMPAPKPAQLLHRLGELTPQKMLWTMMGVSPLYQTFSGLAELLGGVLLLVPRTTLLGALLAAGDMTMVLALNLCYDVPVKINSFHYLVMAVILVAPDGRRLFDVLVLNRAVEPAAPAPLFARKSFERAVQIVFFALGMALLAQSLVETLGRYRLQNPPQPPYYGAWAVDEFAVDGKDVPLFTDPQRWRWAIFQNPGRMTVRTMIGALRTYPLALDGARRTLWLGNDRLALSSPEPDVLVLEGVLGGRSLRAKLRKEPLSSPHLRWIVVLEDE